MRIRPRHPALPAVLIMILAFVSCSEETQLEPYLGEEPPGMEAVLFAPGIISTADHEHSRLEFSGDGMEIFWAVIPVDTNQATHHGSPFDVEGQKIWHVSVVDGQWTSPEAFSFDLGRMVSPALSPGGESLYFRARQPGSTEDRTRIDIFRIEKSEGGGWTEPVLDFIPPLYPDGQPLRSATFCFAGNKNIYFDVFSGDASNPGWDIYRSEYRDGEYLEPVLLGGGVNTGDVNWTPWVAPGEEYLLFSSHREGNLGQGDIYISFRSPDGGWGEPVNLGEKVNTESQERFPSVSPDGRYLFFSRTTDYKTFSDIYWIDSAVLENSGN